MDSSAINPLEPSHPVLGELLDLGLQLIVVHVKVIHSTNPPKQLSRVPATGLYLLLFGRRSIQDYPSSMQE